VQSVLSTKQRRKKKGASFHEDRASFPLLYDFVQSQKTQIPPKARSNAFTNYWVDSKWKKILEGRCPLIVQNDKQAKLLWEKNAVHI
jgi:hypothetical protein